MTTSIYGNEHKNTLEHLFPEEVLHDFRCIWEGIRITFLNISLWQMKKPWKVAPRRIDDTLLWIAYTGTFRCMVNGEYRILRPGEGFAAPENTVHSMSFAPDCAQGSVIVIHVKLRNELGRNPFHFLQTPFFRLPAGKENFHTLQRMIALKNISREATGKHVAAWIRELLMDWSVDGRITLDKLDVCDVRIRKSIDFIYRNLGSDIGVAQIAEAVGLHEVRFRELFLAQTGMTPHSYLKQARLDRVSELLIETVMPLSEIAEITGFRTPSYLCSSFHRRFGQTPQAYRKTCYLNFG